MKNIVVLGAGRSSSALIEYLLKQSTEYNWKVIVADFSLEAAQSKIKNHTNGKAIKLNIEDYAERNNLILQADAVVSLLPPHLHILAAKECLSCNKSLFTASYVSQDISEMDEEARQKGLLFMNECGLDPGIDHMSAVEIIHRIKNMGGEVLSFKSYTGGLIAPESSDNPWRYKFTWNPRNVILAGQSTAQYLENGKVHYTPYRRLFRNTDLVEIDGHGNFDGYANRDSLNYIEHYDLKNVQTLIRGTLRNAGFCTAWDVFVTIGLTDDSFIINECDKYTYASLVRSFLPATDAGIDIIQSVAKLCRIEQEGEVMNMIKWTGILDEVSIPLKKASPAGILQELLERKWSLKTTDKDMVVMNHEFIYRNEGKTKKINSSMVVIGKNSDDTAMAQTVGSPLGIVVKLHLTGKLTLTGVRIPVEPEIYNAVLPELKNLGISFNETEEEIDQLN